MGVWEYGSMGVGEWGSGGVGEWGSGGVWECGNVGMWECGNGRYGIADAHTPTPPDLSYFFLLAGCGTRSTFPPASTDF